MSVASSNPKHVVAIQLSATIVNGGGVEMCSISDPNRTQYSLYLRQADGSARWVKDMSVNDFGKALIEAAKLSILYGVMIEPVEGLDVAPA